MKIASPVEGRFDAALPEKIFPDGGGTAAAFSMPSEEEMRICGEKFALCDFKFRDFVLHFPN